MDKNMISPYVRVAMYSVIPEGNVISERVIYDYEIIFVKDGSCCFNIDGREYNLKKNQVVFIRPGITHSFHIDGSDFVQPHIHFDMAYNEKSIETPVSFKNLCDMTDYEKTLVQEDIFADLDIPFIFVPENPAGFQKVFFDVIDTFSAKENNYQLLCKAGMLRLIDIILSQFQSCPEKQDNNFIITAVKDYIDGNFSENITLDALSSHFFMNKFTMMRKFRRQYGRNIMEYCNEKRIEKSKQLLLQTNLSVKSIGEQLGFSDSYSFSRFFKNACGVSPLKFRCVTTSSRNTL